MLQQSKAIGKEIGQSPIKKKFRNSTISREDIDHAIANGIKLAFKEQQSTLDSVVTSAVRDAVDFVLIPALRKLREDIQATNNSVKELREEFVAMAAAAKQTLSRLLDSRSHSCWSVWCVWVSGRVLARDCGLISASWGLL